MNPFAQFVVNFLENPKTTLTGLTGGSVSAATIYAVFQQAGCNFSLVHWGAIAMAFLAPAAVGGVARDARPEGAKTRATDPPPPVDPSKP